MSGVLRDGGEKAVCSYCFDRDKYTPAEAEQWLQKNQVASVRFEWSKMDAYRNVTAKFPRTLQHCAGRVQIRAVAKIPTYDGQAYDGGPMLPEGFTIPVVVDVQGLELPATVKTFKGHDVDNEVGHGPATKRAGTLQCSGVISGKGQAAREVVDAAKDGFPWELSITADVIGEPDYVPQGKTITANGRNFSGPLVYWRRSQLQEISFVGKGASAHTHVSIAAKAAKPLRSPKMDELLVQWLADHGHEDPSAIKPETLTRLQAKYADEQRARSGRPPSSSNSTRKRSKSARRWPESTAAFARSSRLTTACAGVGRTKTRSTRRSAARPPICVRRPSTTTGAPTSASWSSCDWAIPRRPCRPTRRTAATCSPRSCWRPLAGHP